MDVLFAIYLKDKLQKLIKAFFPSLLSGELSTNQYFIYTARTRNFPALFATAKIKRYV